MKQGSTPPDTLTKLKKAHTKISELRANTELTKAPSFTFDWNQDNGVVHSKFHERPSINSVKAGLTDIRHFLLQKSTIRWSSLTKICREHCPQDKQTLLSQLGRQWSIASGNKASSSNTGFSLTLNDVQLTRKKLLDLWMNGYVFHLDDAASNEIELLREGGPMVHIAELEIMYAVHELSILLFTLDEQFIVPILKAEIR